jgi:hypothetical protein
MLASFSCGSVKWGKSLLLRFYNARESRRRGQFRLFARYDRTAKPADGPKKNPFDSKELQASLTARRLKWPDNPPLTPPHPAALFRAPNLRYRYHMETRLDRRCLRCDKGFRAQRISAKYCTSACRQMAYLRRRYPPGDDGPLTWADFGALLWRPTPPDPD